MNALYVDACVFATLAEIDHTDVLAELGWTVVIPREIADELADEPAASHLTRVREADSFSVLDQVANEAQPVAANLASSYLDCDGRSWSAEGDVALLAYALHNESLSTIDRTVIATDDRPLRSRCHALDIDVTSTIGILVSAVEHGALESEEAKEAMLAIDEVGPRVSVTSLRTAVRLINEIEATGASRAETELEAEIRSRAE
ncbi:hypothetical protein OB955_18095 [Halobacteria archaeon AArc-m2/3/4]|uniref:Uncharacterized protein n=1 Tax=Natronoglomus mannanivorans TaxID=2979990 RepID=A0AAP2Z4A2_9EURY|nr:hypothetical protein [Halobacteria archaeon AArc-xg1-1]MCU4974635.1 hypothetical protein [Halobacteria archaeon AArc-m2/3/4]